MVLLVLGYLGKKVFKKIDGICCSHKFKDMILVLRSELVTFELVTFVCINWLCSTWIPWQKNDLKKINGTSRYHEFKAPVIVIRNAKKQRYFLLARVCQ